MTAASSSTPTTSKAKRFSSKSSSATPGRSCGDDGLTRQRPRREHDAHEHQHDEHDGRDARRPTTGAGRRGAPGLDFDCVSMMANRMSTLMAPM